MLLCPLRAFISVCSLPVFYQRYTSGILEVCLNLRHLRCVLRVFRSDTDKCRALKNRILTHATSLRVRAAGPRPAVATVEPAPVSGTRYKARFGTRLYNGLTRMIDQRTGPGRNRCQTRNQPAPARAANRSTFAPPAQPSFLSSHHHCQVG